MALTDTQQQVRRLTVATVLLRHDGTPLARFESPHRLERVARDHPDWCLDPIIAEHHGP